MPCFFNSVCRWERFISMRRANSTTLPLTSRNPFSRNNFSAASLAVFLATTFGGAIATLPAGLGTYEAAAVAVLTGLGYGFEEAVILAFAMHGIQFIITVPLTVVILVTERTGVSSLCVNIVAAFKSVKQSTARSRITGD